MENKINGIHHITALASDPQKNYDFYTGVLGLRLVKKTVNFDAPDVYHLYYGDETGRPGTILTFFPFPGTRRGKRGTGEISAVAFSIPESSLNYWMDRFAELAIGFDGPHKRFDETYISILDPDGMNVELVVDEAVGSIAGWNNGRIPFEHSIRKIFGATFYTDDSSKTELLLLGTMGFNFTGTSDSRKRYTCGSDESLARIDLIENGKKQPASGGAGSVHHIAWRTAGDEEQLGWHKKITDAGFYPTKVMDRNYFRSIYFREPGGILFEIATDSPGFLIDESLDNLGTSLKLPAWYEEKRYTIENILLPLETVYSKKNLIN
ncbi:MAG: VOC family protein [Melioribacteraceae bacterium]|nr:VOC family protein [Melioribacteraceae bacterium]